ncbi:ERF family protein [Lachnospiraceae bacterium 46-61]
MSVYSKLFEIQQNLKAPKGQYNKFGKYTFRSCEDILEALKPLLASQKAIIVLSDELTNIEQRYYIKATARIIDIETGEQITNSAYAREDENKKGMDLSQITGASSSYARKYALNGLFCIDDNKDSDTTNIYKKESQKQQNKKYCCEICGKEFEGFKTKNKEYTAEQEFILKHKKFGQALCNDCIEKRGLKNE